MHQKTVSCQHPMNSVRGGRSLQKALTRTPSPQTTSTDLMVVCVLTCKTREMMSAG